MRHCDSGVSRTIGRILGEHMHYVRAGDLGARLASVSSDRPSEYSVPRAEGPPKEGLRGKVDFKRANAKKGAFYIEEGLWIYILLNNHLYENFLRAKID